MCIVCKCTFYLSHRHFRYWSWNHPLILHRMFRVLNYIFWRWYVIFFLSVFVLRLVNFVFFFCFRIFLLILCDGCKNCHNYHSMCRYSRVHGESKNEKKGAWLAIEMNCDSNKIRMNYENAELSLSKQYAKIRGKKWNEISNNSNLV